MRKNWKAALTTFVFAAGAFGAGAAFTASASAQTPGYALRGDRASDRSLRGVDSRLEQLIDQLSRDDRDYDGHRVAAISDMQQARAQLDAALRYDNHR